MLTVDTTLVVEQLPPFGTDRAYDRRYAMGIFDEIKNLADSNKGETDSLVKDGEQFADSETGNQFDSEIQQGGNFAEQEMGTEQNNQ